MSSDLPPQTPPSSPSPVPPTPPGGVFYPAPPAPSVPVVVAAPAKSSGTSWIFWILGIFLFIALGISMLFNVGLFAALNTAGKAADNIEYKAVRGNIWASKWIAVIDISGMITSSGDMVENYVKKIHAVAAKDEVKAVVIRINSPGGEVYASDVLYNETKRLRDQYKKPVVIYMETMATSGGYYMAMGGTKILANDVTLTGSIGVIMQSFNAQGLMEMARVRPMIFKSGKMKDLGNMFREMTEDERKYVQDLIDETYGKFVGIVARERKIDEKTLRDGVADGRVLTGKVALENKLIDKLGYVDDAVLEAKSLAKITGDDYAIVQVNRLSNLAQVLGLSAEGPNRGPGASTTIRLQIGPDSLPLEAGKLYYLSSHLLLGTP
ncbi:signal peptide peptidase SppA [Verrucomicrobia bacterium LW23]|nr:signal peptide peptidase SppA [Verrucomicrobia bacterium LW23]